MVMPGIIAADTDTTTKMIRGWIMLLPLLLSVPPSLPLSVLSPFPPSLPLSGLLPVGDAVGLVAKSQELSGKIMWYCDWRKICYSVERWEKEVIRGSESKPLKWPIPNQSWYIHILHSVGMCIVRECNISRSTKDAEIFKVSFYFYWTDKQSKRNENIWMCKILRKGDNSNTLHQVTNLTQMNDWN